MFYLDQYFFFGRSNLTHRRMDGWVKRMDGNLNQIWVNFFRRTKIFLYAHVKPPSHVDDRGPSSSFTD